MNNLFLFFILLPSFLFAQDSKLLGIVKEKVLTDSGSVITYFNLIDTIGDYQNGNYYIRFERLDSSQLVASLYNKAMSNYNRIGNIEGEKITCLQSGNAYRLKAAEVVGVDGYRQYVMPIVRESMAGTYAIRYGQNIHRIELEANGVARDAEGTLIMTHAPMSTTWTTVVYRVGEQENIQCYQIQPGVWLGDGAQGRLVLRKI